LVALVPWILLLQLGALPPLYFFFSLGLSHEAGHRFEGLSMLPLPESLWLCPLVSSLLPSPPLLLSLRCMLPPVLPLKAALAVTATATGSAADVTMAVVSDAGASPVAASVPAANPFSLCLWPSAAGREVRAASVAAANALCSCATVPSPPPSHLLLAGAFSRTRNSDS